MEPSVELVASFASLRDILVYAGVLPDSDDVAKLLDQLGATLDTQPAQLARIIDAELEQAMSQVIDMTILQRSA
eukprot:16428976-Heterocapsa_arctica.AAC.1